jgi:steroid-24-oyl-CoA synthetase
MTTGSAALSKPWPAVSLAQAHALLTRPGSPFQMEERVIRGVRTRVWKHAMPTLREVFAAGRAHGQKTFLVYEDDRATFEAFARAALAVAETLTKQGVRKGDRVAIVMRNLPEWPVAFFGVLLTGAIATPLNAWWTGPELEYGLTDSGAKVAIVDAERLQRLAGHVENCPGLERIYVARADGAFGGPRIARLEDVIGRVADWGALPDRPMPVVALEPDDHAAILYTSGTTGKPKGATAPQRATLVGIPLFHTTGSHAILGPALYNGAKLVLMRRWDPELGMRLIERERVTHAGGVPTIAWQLIEHPARESYDLSSLESVSYGGAPGTPELVRRIKQVFPKSAPGLGWGMTETSATFTSHGAEDYENRPDSSGPALPVCDMRIVGERGENLPLGTVGELWAKGPNVVDGYWNKPEATAETFIDGWLKTGDLARLDEEGFLYVVDRKKDMLIRGGENIYCIEVEDALYRHPAIMDAALVGLPHKTLGEEPAAVVTLKQGTTATEEELRAFVAGQLAAFKVPVRVVFQRDMLPRNANGKIVKAELRKLFEAPVAGGLGRARVG